MILNITYVTPLGGKPVADVVATLELWINKMLPNLPHFLGASVAAHEDGVMLRVQCKGMDRWRAQAQAVKVATVLLVRAGLNQRDARMLEMRNEPTDRVYNGSQRHADILRKVRVKPHTSA